MATSGTTTFALDLTELAEEAWERAGRPMRSGYDLRTARRSLNLLLIEWQNRGLNMWTFDSDTIALTEGDAVYQMPNDTVDVMDCVIRTNAGSESLQNDLAITRISQPTYTSIPNKLTPGRPLQMLVTRGVDNPTLTLWPVPDQDSYYTLVYWRLRRMEDAGDGVNTPDVNYRFLPALVAGLAFYIATKTPALADRIVMLEAQYERQFQLASEEDREKASMRLVPRMRY